MDQAEIKQIVDEVADLIKQYYSVQNYAGEYDYVPHKIAHAIKLGYIKCPRCNGYGKIKCMFDEAKNCYFCNGKGTIDFTIPSMKE